MEQKHKENVFSKVTTPTGLNLEILEGKGRHYFKALSKSKGDSGLLIKYLIMQLVVFENKNNILKQVDEMHMRDISYLGEVIALMLSNDFK
jgi:hypothetical protein